MEMDRIDVLIVTAVPEEYAAVLAAGGGEAAWSTSEASTGVTVAARSFDVAAGSLRVAVTQALGMGGASAVMAAAELIEPHRVQCLAMCGVCAGKRGDVALGDVIIADRVWQYGAGKRKAETVGGTRVVKEEDIDTFQIRPLTWGQRAERFQVDPRAAWLKGRPRSPLTDPSRRGAGGLPSEGDRGRIRRLHDPGPGRRRQPREVLHVEGEQRLGAHGLRGGEVERVEDGPGAQSPGAAPIEGFDVDAGGQRHHLEPAQEIADDAAGVGRRDGGRERELGQHGPDLPEGVHVDDALNVPRRDGIEPDDCPGVMTVRSEEPGDDRGGVQRDPHASVSFSSASIRSSRSAR
jgi:hypothetical protein